MSATSLSLFEIETELTSWVDTLALAEGDEAASAEIQRRVDEYLQAATEKRDRVNAFLSHLEILERLAREEEARLAQRRKALAASRERLESYVINTMQTLGVRKLFGNTSELRLAKNPESVVITDFAEIPERFLHRQKPAPEREPDKPAIRFAIKAGEIVPGADLRFGADRLERR